MRMDLSVFVALYSLVVYGASSCMHLKAPPEEEVGKAAAKRKPKGVGKPAAKGKPKATAKSKAKAKAKQKGKTPYASAMDAFKEQSPDKI